MHLVEQVRDAGLPVDAPGHGLGDRRADRHPRVQRRVRVLEDHLHPAAVAAGGATRLTGQDVMPVQEEAPGGGGLQARDDAGERRLARSGPPHQGEDLTAVQSQVDAVQRTDSAPREQPSGGEVLAQASYLQDRFRKSRMRGLGTRTVRQPRDKGPRRGVGG